MATQKEKLEKFIKEAETALNGVDFKVIQGSLNVEDGKVSLTDKKPNHPHITFSRSLILYPKIIRSTKKQKLIAVKTDLEQNYLEVIKTLGHPPTNEELEGKLRIKHIF
jgi:hypothetical protein